MNDIGKTKNIRQIPLRIFRVLQKDIKNIFKILDTIMLRCILENIPKYVIKKYIQTMLLMSIFKKNYGYKSLKV